MKKFSEYITGDNIISYLIRFRVKKAKEGNKRNIIQRISTKAEYNFSNRKPLKTENELKALLPSRRKWLTLRKSSRYKNGQLLNTLDKNKLILEKTIKYYRSHHASEPFVQNLNKFILDIQRSCRDEDYVFNKPEIYPKLKKKNAKDKVCRPISNYQLKDKIIICLTNKYFADLFDEYFSDYSYAFRSTRRKEDGAFSSLMHHDAFDVVRKYRERFEGNKLYVAECDIKKFYDSVNHTQIKKAFRRLYRKVKCKKTEYYSADAERLFYLYLDSYTFNKNALILNDKKNSYFKDHNIEGGEFGWVKGELISNNFYGSFNNAKIGVPQGGALSGLIANIVLDYVDREISKHRDDNLFYIRYCDDMLIIHPDEDVCLKMFNVYQNALKKLKLIPHKPQTEKRPAEFWKLRSKSPYLWAKNTGNNEQPWIGFVGYELHWDGHVRVRKKSLEKEIHKQKEVVYKALKAIEGGFNKVSPNAIEESVINTLIGMSVGRIELWNHKDCPNELCWANGFKLIKNNENKYSKIQLKRLDRSRNNLINELRRKMRKMPLKTTKPKKESSGKQIVYYGKPFSYYYNLIEKSEKRDQSELNKCPQPF